VSRFDPSTEVLGGSLKIYMETRKGKKNREIGAETVSGSTSWRFGATVTLVRKNKTIAFYVKNMPRRGRGGE